MNSNWSYSPEMPNLGQIWQFFTSVTLTFDLWPWPFAWTSLWSLVINFMMILWWEHCQKGVTDRQTDGQTEIAVLKAAWSQLKIPLGFASQSVGTSQMTGSIWTVEDSMTLDVNSDNSIWTRPGHLCLYIYITTILWHSLRLCFAIAVTQKLF